jgi:hypothetical protein
LDGEEKGGGDLGRDRRMWCKIIGLIYNIIIIRRKDFSVN